MADLAIHKDRSTSTDLAFFLSSFLLEGLQRCSGVLFAGTQGLTDESRQTASIPFAVSWAVAHITSVATKYAFEWKKTEGKLLLGTILCGTGAALSFLETNVIWLSVCWGVLFGAGVGVAFPESLKLSQKFRSQNFFSVLSSAASSFGCLFLPYLMDKLLANFGVNGCLLLIAGIILNMIPLNLMVVYKIHFCFWIKKWRIRKKSKQYKVTSFKHSSNNSQELKEIKTISNGICNEGFQQDSCAETQNMNCKNNANENSVSISNRMKENGNHNKNIITNLNSLEDSLRSKSINKFQKNCNAERERNDLTKTQINRHLFEKSFSKEDVLFEAIPENVENQVISNEKRKSVTKSSCSVQSNKDKIRNLDVHEGNNTASGPPVIESVNQNFLVTKPRTPAENNNRFTFPLEIKVHVVECTFTATNIEEVKNFGRTLPNSKKLAYRRHSNSLITSCYEHIDFTSPNFLKNYGKSSQFCGHSNEASSKMYLISEDDEFATDCNTNSRASVETECNPPTQQNIQLIWLKTLKKLFKPSYLVIIYSFVIYKITLITLLMIFDDLAKDVSVNGGSNVNVVLIVFGLGGIAGRLSLRYWGERLLLEGSHSAAAVLFILNGVVIAGILWSPNLYWIAGFYSILGFLEIGISTTIWNLVRDYTDEKANSVLFSTCTLICGLGTLCVPYIIGLSRDDLEEYDGLLQIASCLSVLCAILCYILPRFPDHLKLRDENQFV